MVVTISGGQQDLLDSGRIEPRILVDIRDKSDNHLRFTNNDAFFYEDNLYQPGVVSISNFKTSALFPENKQGTSTVTVSFENAPYEDNGTVFSHLSRTFDTFEWELSDCDVKLLLSSGTGTSETEGIAMPIISSGIVGTPQNITRESFSVPIGTRNVKFNDEIPLRQVSQEDFPEVDRDELSGRQYIPILVGSGIRVRALSTTAGAVTTVRTEVSTGTTLNVSETTGFNNGDSIFIGGQVADPFVIGTVDAGNNQFTGLSPNLNTLPNPVNVGDIVNEDKALYSYTVADHKIGTITDVYVYKTSTSDPVLIDAANWTQTEVADAKALGGFRTDIDIDQLTTLGGGTDGSVTQQPDHQVDNANHNHSVALDGGNNGVENFANSVSPGGASNANDGNVFTQFLMNNANNTINFLNHPALDGTFINQRYFCVVQTQSSAPTSWDVRRNFVNYLSITTVVAYGEFRSSLDTGGSETSDVNHILVGGSGAMQVFEGWKSVTMSATVDESNVNLTNTSIIVNVAINITGANLEVGDKVEVVCDGIQAEDWTGGSDLGAGTITRPDYVAIWVLEHALAQTAETWDSTTYDIAATTFASNGYSLQFAVQKPITFDKLMDQIANNSKCMAWYGRDGHNLLPLVDADSITDSDVVATWEEDKVGVQTIDWSHSTGTKDIKNTLTGLFDRDWTKTANKEESYTGTVLGQDTSSVTLYGELKNEVRGDIKEMFLDLTPNEPQAQDIMSFVAGHKGFPRKKFTAKTDWTYFAIEPGDIIDARPITGVPAYARVVQNIVDPNYFCTIDAIEIANSAPHPPPQQPVFDQNTSIDFDTDIGKQLQNLTAAKLGFGDSLTVMFRWKQNSGVASTTYFPWIFASPTSSANLLRHHNTQSGSPREPQTLLYGNNASDHKFYKYGNFYSGFGVWYQVFITWEGSTQTLKFRHKSIGIDFLNDRAPQTISDDDFIAVDINAVRRVQFLGQPQAYIHDCAVWNKVLGDDEMLACCDDGDAEGALRNTTPNYTSGGNLVHWWRFGFNSSGIGDDYADAGFNRDVMEDSAGIGPAQIVNAKP